MFKIRPTKKFEREARALIKKYASFKSDLSDLGKELINNPYLGVSIGKSCYKVRLAIGSKGKGKSGGARVITYTISEEKVIMLLSVYDKKEKENLAPNELDELLRDLDFS